MGKYRTLGTLFNRVFRNDLNQNFEDIDKDIQTQKKRVDDLITKTPQPSEVVDARGGHPVLRDRLDSVDAQLAEKAQVSAVTALDSKVTTDRKRNQQAIRRELDSSGFQPYQLPAGFAWQSAPIKLFTNGTKFTTDFDVSVFKNVSTNTYWVDPVNGLDTNAGTEVAPFKSLEKAYQTASSGDTIKMKPGIYYRDSSWQSISVLQKSLNIIGEGTVIIPLSDKHTYTKTAGQTNVYQTARTNVAEVIDLTFDPVGYKYQKKNTLAECDALPGSYYTDATTLFIHSLDSNSPNPEKVLPLLSAQHFKVNNSLGNVKIYLENLTIFGGNNGNLWLDRINASNGLSVYAKNCDFLHSTGLNVDGDAVNIDGADEAFFQNCRALHSRKDGFNYTAYNSASALVTAPKFIEVDCVGAYNGIPNTLSPNTNNGSTAHAGAQGIRVNGQYYKNMGANVADVQPGTESLNLGCIAFDSLTGLDDATNGDFVAQQSGAKMWVNACISFGSKYNLYAMSGTTMYVDNTQFDTKQGSGTFIITNQL
ncbi:DUF1565 domain-containing protein [Neobacillus sedimentimangrovi]|uniref:DUF1565 domain-containing protein n=1 Tax=Neobacillus sedimentimangrovi TaxID=2699460 RepID=UPI0013D24E81|nr:DUF1565 domain-containing protein [Neobacillus sedimentimangrovi]